MIMTGEKATKRQRDTSTTDRISELPDFILLIILSLLDTKEACRASVLSKRWYGVWSSIPVLDFQRRYFKKGQLNYLAKNVYGFYDSADDLYCSDVPYDDIVKVYLEFIDKTMQRYSTQKYRMTKLILELPMKDKKLQSMFDKWIKIAVQNQIQELDIKIVHDIYTLPEILFSAKSLKVLKCSYVKLPYYETMELISLEYLTLFNGTLDADMLQKVVSFCPLLELDITNGGLKKSQISVPWTRKVNGGAECFDSGTMQSNLKTSPLRKFAYHGNFDFIPWAFDMNLGALRNLRKLEIACAAITDDSVFELAHGLIHLKCLVLTDCKMLERINISSVSLKVFKIVDGIDLVEVTINAPNLLKFWYNCEVEASLSIEAAHDCCNAHFFPIVETITTDWFVKLKKFLKERGFFESLVMDLSETEIVIEEDELRNDVTSPPYKLKELKLLKTSAWVITEYSLLHFLDGLFWSCHPDVVSMTTSFQNRTAELFLDILKWKVHCWKHPLKSIDVERADYSNFLLEPSEFEIRFRLSWLSV